MILRALTVRQPWAALIVAGVKDVENRSWRPAVPVDVLIIHSAERRADHPDGVIRVEGDDRRGVILGTVRMEGVTKDSPSPWALDDLFHWQLADPVRLAEPIPCTGKYGLWMPPPAVIRQLRLEAESLSLGQ
jgi:hypothetical protein